MRPLKALLQNVSTKKFYKSETEWVTEADAAFDFVHMVPALQFALKQGWSDVRVVLTFGDPEYNIYMEPEKKRADATEADRLIRQEEHWNGVSEAFRAAAADVDESIRKRGGDKMP